MTEKQVLITKMSGEVVPFDAAKLRHSLERSGASEAAIDAILKTIEAELYEEMPTKEIYKRAFALLRKHSRPTAARYKLKKAIKELGPSGYPFENFVARILAYQGFAVNVGVIVKGHCVNHEVDVVAEKDEKHFMVECKFHGAGHRHCDVKIPLYIQSRFKDVERQWKKRDGHDKKFHQGWIFTNTRFTKDAIQYGNCAGLELIGWDHPGKGNLKERIDIAGLHPITSLTTLSKKEKKKLLMKEKVLCMDICDEPDSLSRIGIKENRHKAILSEAHEVCDI